MRLRAATALGLGACAFGAATLALWVPLDSASGLVETVRRRTSIGDALAPSVAAAVVVLGGLLVLMRDRGGAGLTRANLSFVLSLLALIGASLLVMRWTGPLILWALGEGVEAYRPLRDTTPWKHLGYLAGGTLLVTALIARGEGRLGGRALLLGALATIALIALYDLPFEDLLLPPNGDV